MDTLIGNAVLTAAPPYATGNDTQPDMPGNLPLGAAHFSIIGGSLLVYFLVLLPLIYTLGSVVATLTIIETPNATTIPKDQLPPPYRDDEEADLIDSSIRRETRAPVAPVATADGIAVDDDFVFKEAVTSSIRGTIRHITRIGGFWARWRGFSAACAFYIASNIAMGALVTLLGILPLPKALLSMVASAIAVALLCPIHMAWTHAIIAEPSPLRWYKRVRYSRKYWTPLIPPAIVYGLSSEFVSLITALIAGTFMKSVDSTNSGSPNEPPKPITVTATVGGACLILAWIMFGFTMIVLPTMAIMTRVEAAMLPEDQQTVVKFDRTFDGAMPEKLDSFKDMRAMYRAAWRSFDRKSYRRLVGFYAKYYALTIAMTAVVMGIIVVVLVVALRK